MSILRLENKGEPDILPVPGVFIDYYLPAASGQDIKIFLYLLRQASRSASLSWIWMSPRWMFSIRWKTGRKRGCSG